MHLGGFDALEGRIAALTRANRVPGLSIAVVGADGERWQRGFGVTDLSSGIPVGARTPYLWFSMTKIVTATAVLRLAGTGALHLDAPVTDYLPTFARVVQPRPVTVRHLLSHSSGLANPLPIRWVRPADAPAPDQAAFVERLLARHRRLAFAPGERARYSNLGYLVLGQIVAAVAGEPFETHLRTHVLGALGMAQTGFSYADVGDEEPATGYQRLPAALTPLLRAILPAGIVAGRQGRYVAYKPFHVLGAAYGGLVGGVADAARLAMLHLNDGVVDGMRLLPAGLGIVIMGNTTRYDHEAILAAVIRSADRRSLPPGWPPARETRRR
ncbi:serine hydrolase domain-containing protein [Actinophytocola sp.]|uniref:serine hydrolase domain-containing protein n=1 Tax=Actinophytocola sp. TaxID=1872138 RepID=UPI002D7E8F1C|nr:serine hydrolase domain-containing protein [Actinophytocola sp.]HET9139928.1 serine hydrolase domain-containing protein [Actinophytocola sp.]